MRRLAVFGALLLVAAGCGGGSKSTQSGTSPAENPIAAAATKTSQAGSVKIDFGIAGKAVKGGGRGVFDTSTNGC